MDPIFRRTVACAVERQTTRARNLLDTVPGSHAEASIIGSFRSRLNWCYIPVEGGIGFSWSLFRGGVAEIFYRRAFPSGLPREPAGDVASAWSQARAVTTGHPEIEMLHATARCVVLRQPGTVSEMLAGAPLSREEMRALRALQADVSACLDSGIEFTASRQSLRGLLAEAAFHYGEAQRSGFAGIAARDARPD